MSSPRSSVSRATLGVLLVTARLFLKARYVIVVGLSFLGLYLILANSGQTDNDKIRMVLVFSASLAVFFLFDRVSRRRKAPYFWNFTRSERVERISELLRCCRKKLVVVAGTFDGAWETEPVLDALSQLPLGVEVYLYRTSSSALMSQPLRAWIEGRDLSVVHLPEPIKHRIIVDDLHVRVEFNDSGHVPLFRDGRPAMFFYNEPEMVHEAMEGLTKALVAHGLEGTLKARSKDVGVETLAVGLVVTR